MTEAASNLGTRRLSYYRRPKDYNFTLAFAALAALLHTYALVAELTALRRSVTLASPSILLLFAVVELGLVANMFGLWLRRAAGVVVSLVGLASVGVSYALWYVYSKQVLELLLSKPFYQSHAETIPPHPFGLLGATWVNQAVLLMSCVLFIWTAKTLRSMTKASRACGPDAAAAKAWRDE
jgi:hypothetical protein